MAMPVSFNLRYYRYPNLKEGDLYLGVIALPFEIRIHKKFLVHLHVDIDIPTLTANEHGYRKPIDSSEQLPSYA